MNNNHNNSTKWRKRINSKNYFTDGAQPMLGAIKLQIKPVNLAVKSEIQDVLYLCDNKHTQM